MSQEHGTAAKGGQGIPAAGAVIAGKYEVQGSVGEGGMGVVVAARHIQLGQTVALKLLRPEVADSQDTVGRFLREAKAAATLESDHVVRIYDVGTLENGAPFMVMELLRGVDLRVLLDQHATIPVERAVEYLLQACSAIAVAHAHGIVHRDLKPSNLFLAKRGDGAPLIKVLDFGISKAMDPGSGGNVDLTSTNSIVGSPKYMAPEQIRDARGVDTRADIWALGVLLHEMLAGSPPFEAGSMSAMCATIAADPPASTCAANPDVPRELEAVVRRCLEKDPANRYQTVAELVEALRPFSGRSSSSFALPHFAADATLRSSVAEQATIAVNPQAPATANAPGERTRSALASSQEPHDTSRRFRRIAVTSLAIAAALTVVVITSRRESDVREAVPAPVTAPSSGPVALATYTLSLDSVPSGATVLEGDRVLGTTPTRITMDNAALGKSPRRLSLRLDGFVPYDLVQGTSAEDVRVLAPLVKETPAPASAAPSAKAAPPAAPAPRHTAPRTNATTPDIQLQR